MSHGLCHAELRKMIGASIAAPSTTTARHAGLLYPKLLFSCADFPGNTGQIARAEQGGRSCFAKRMECVELAPAVRCVARFDSGSKLHALHTLRALWFRLRRPVDRRALPAALAVPQV